MKFVNTVDYECIPHLGVDNEPYRFQRNARGKVKSKSLGFSKKFDDDAGFIKKEEREPSMIIAWSEIFKLPGEQWRNKFERLYRLVKNFIISLRYVSYNGFFLKQLVMS